MLKKLVSATLVIMIMLTGIVFPDVGISGNLAVKAKENGEYRYVINSDNTVNIKKYLGNSAEVTIPSTIDGAKVVAIDMSSFSDYEFLTSVVIPDSVKTIGAWAFGDCTSLTSIKIGKNVETIEEYAFEWCKSLTSVTIPDNVKVIEDCAFLSCRKLTNVYIGKNLYAIGEEVFSGTSVTDFTVSEDNRYSYSIDGVLFDKDNELVAYPTGRTDTHYTVPEGTTAILSDAFHMAVYLKSVTIPDGVESIGDDAFYLCTELSVVKISDDVKRIGFMAFRSTNISTFDFPENLTSIGDWAFSSTELTEAYLPSKVSDVGYGIFERCSISISVDPDNKYLCTVDGVLFSKDMKKLYQYPYNKTDTSYIVPDGVEEICGGAFNGAKLTSVSLPDSLEKIGFMAFAYSGLNMEKLEIPDYVTDIDMFGFSNCEITELTLGQRVKTLGYGAFESSLKNGVYFKGNGINMKGDSPFPINTPIYYPKDDPTWTSDLLIDDYKWDTWYTPVFYTSDIADATITLSQTSYEYNWCQNKPKVTVKHNGKLLKEGEHYKLTYTNTYYPGTATVNITGINDYQGEVKKNYTIAKREQTLSASLSADSIEVGDYAEVLYSATGDVKFKSSNTSCATIDDYGFITAKAKGTTKITVTALETDCYKKATKTLTLNVNAVVTHNATLDTLTYSFSNGYDDFGYSTDYRIPLNKFYMFYSKDRAKQLYNSYGYWGGSCSGMSATSMMFNMPYDSLEINDFNSSAKKVSDLSVKNRNYDLDMTIKDLIEAVHISQSTSEYYYDRNQTNNDIQYIFDTVKAGKAPVWIAVFSPDGAGHAIVGYKTKKISSTESRIYVYDCNRPKKERYIKVKTNSSGKCTGWYYSINDKHPCSSDYNPKESFIDCVDYKTIKYVWENRNKSGKPLEDFDYCNSMTINSENFEIQNQSGTTVATMKNGIFNSTVKDIYESETVQSDGVVPENHLIYMPTTEYKIVNTEEDNKQLEITMVNNNQTVEIDTVADTVDLHLDATKGTNIIDLDGAQGAYYKVEMTSSADSEENIESVVYKGKCGEEEVSVGVSDDELVAKNHSDSSVIVDDQYMNFTNEATETITDSKYYVGLSDTSFACDGTRKEPQVTVQSNYGNSELIEGVDYEVVYTDNLQAGKATVTVYGINDYKGSIEKTFDIKQKISAPKSFTATTKTNEIKLTWNKVENASGYDIQQYKNNEWVTIEKAPNGNIQSYTIKDLSPATSYKIRIRAYIAKGIDVCYGAFSNELSATTGYLSAPKITKMENVKGGTKITWSKIKGAEKYRLLKKSGNSWKTITTTTSNSYTHKISKSNITTTYSVRCLNADNKYISNLNSKGYTNKYIAVPELSSIKNTAKGIKFTFKKVVGAPKYRIYRKKGKGSWRKLADISNKKTSYTDKKVKKGTKYSYTVRCVSKNGKTSVSAYNTKGLTIKRK